MSQRRIEQAVYTGERNREASELVKNWCAHVSIVRMGGHGWVEQETGLPIGHMGLTCQFAQRGGMMAWELTESACHFYDQNCVGCGHRQPVGIPNLSILVARRDESRQHEALQQAEHTAELARQHAARKRERAAVRAGLNAIAASVIDQLDELDEQRTKELRETFVKTASVAPDAFPSATQDYVLGAIERGESWLTEAGLSALLALPGDPARLTRAAMHCLARYDHVWLVAKIIESHLEYVDEALVPSIVAPLIDLALPHKGPFGPSVPAQPTTLLAIYARYPGQVERGGAHIALAEQRRHTSPRTDNHRARVFLRFACFSLWPADGGYFADTASTGKGTA
jgi:hypothetical protein